METENKIDLKEKEVQKPGPPWKTVGIFSSYEKADEKKGKLLTELETHQVKIKRYGEAGKEFIVKMRKDPALKEVEEK